MEELDGKLDAFYSFRTLIFVVFALAVFAVMCNALSEFYEYINNTAR